MSLDLASQSLRVGPYRLALLAESDAPDLLTLFGDPEVVEFMDIEPLQTLAEAREIVAWARELAGDDKGLRWSIRRDGEPGLVGTVGFNTLELSRGRRGEIAYDLARVQWGQGVMAQILPQVIDFGFRTLGLRRLEAMVTVGNARSCALLERQGFLREGTLREHAYWKGRFWDQLVYARLAD
jgi:ribosomal-protein-alanine N-acetyltransferase